MRYHAVPEDERAQTRLLQLQLLALPQEQPTVAARSCPHHVTTTHDPYCDCSTSHFPSPKKRHRSAHGTSCSAYDRIHAVCCSSRETPRFPSQTKSASKTIQHHTTPGVLSYCGLQQQVRHQMRFCAHNPAQPHVVGPAMVRKSGRWGHLGRGLQNPAGASADKQAYGTF
jgi:hypothetical protein